MFTLEGVEVKIYSFFNLGANEGGCSTPRPAALPAGMRHGTHCTGGWVGPRAAWKGARNLFHTGIPSPDPPPRSESMFGETDKNIDKSKRS